MTTGVDVPRGQGPMIALVAVILLIHFLFRPALQALPVAPDLLTGGLLLATLHLRAGYAALLGFVLGVLEAAIGLDGMGRISVVYVLTGYLGARSRDLLFADARYYVFAYLFVGTWLTRLGLMVVTGIDLDVYAVVVAGGVVAALTAVVCGAAEVVVERLRG